MSGKNMSEKKIPKSKGKWHGGKGSVQKPNDQDKYADGWDAIWGKKQTDEFPDRARPDGLVWEKHRREKKDLSKRERLLMDPPLHINKEDKKDDNP